MLQRPFIVPVYTESPILLITGILSPVSIDSSRDVSPEIIVPSTGTLSPECTVTTSQILSSDIGSSIKSPPRITLALSGTNHIKPLTASDTRRFARASRYFPNETNTKRNAAVSKNNPGTFIPCNQRYEPVSKMNFQ